MAEDIMKVVGICRATKAPYVNDKGTFMSIRVAWTTRGPGDDGKWEDRSNYGNVVVLGERAGRLAEYIDKGSRLGIDGDFEMEEYDDDGGNKVTTYRVVARNIQLLGDPRSDDDGGSRRSAGRSSGGSRRSRDDWD